MPECPYQHHPSVLHCTAADSTGNRTWERFGLTRREQDTAALLIRGYRNKGIAVTLCVEVRTIRAHVAALLKKTKTTNRTAAALALSH